jgi:hypothetical protein
MAASCGLAMGGILLMTDDDVTRVLTVQSIIFLVAQAFTLTRVSRDWNTFNIGNTARPTLAYFVQVVAFFIVALGLSIYSLARSVSGVVEWQGFYAMSLLWTTVSALCLSKAVRDRNDAGIFAKLPVESQAEQFPDVLRICNGTLEYKVFVWMSALASLGAMLGIMWTWDAEVMAVERKGFVSVCVLWCEASSFHLAKLVRDRADPMKSKELRTQLPFQALVVIASVSSFSVLLGGIFLMPLKTPKKVFLVVGSGFMLSTAFFLAKHVRDQLELKNVLERPDPTVPVHASVVEGTDCAPSAF